jgi:phage gpG-like protein
MDTKALDKLIKSLKNPPMAKVGILGNNRKEGSNAEIGAKHELGLDGMPVRSFLRMPLIEHLQENLEKSQAFDEDVLKKVVKAGDVTEWLKKVITVAEAVIREGFQTGGYGKWPAWRGGYSNRTGLVLVDTQQLRDSITSEVVS